MSDSDEGEAEFTGMSVSSTEEQQERAADRALREIKHAHDDEKALPEDACRVCGEVWEEFHEDADGNPILDEHGKTQHDELVICEGCLKPYHQSCYGIVEVPEGDYYCWACKAGKEQGDIKCVICLSREWRGFCNVKYDRAKTDAQTLHDHRRHPHFAHTACAHWMPPCEFGKAEQRNPATRIEEIVRTHAQQSAPRSMHTVFSGSHCVSHSSFLARSLAVVSLSSAEGRLQPQVPSVQSQRRREAAMPAQRLCASFPPAVRDRSCVGARSQSTDHLHG